MKMKSYNHKKIDKKWQKKWAESKIYKTSDLPTSKLRQAGKKKGGSNFYTLVEFPYPSGNLHVGHWYAFSMPDIFARFKRMRGHNVLYPIGFDAFGLPAENAAIKHGLNPRKWTYQNIKYMESQLQNMGASFDWERKIVTSDPEYYRWTQWMFIQFFKNNLAYQKETLANWCPSCKTVLANEQVVNGHCERCDSEAQKKKILQWNLKITDYAERLLNDLEKLPWPEPIKESQRNWIGKSEGAEINFQLTIPENKTRFVILHGYTGSAQKNFIPWLKKALKNQGHEVETPELPNSKNPNENDQVEYVLKNCHFDENTVVIGHSLGGVVAMKALMRLNKSISGLVLVAPAIDPKFHKADSRPFWKGFSWDYDYSLIKKLTGEKITILSDKREKNRAPYLKYLTEKLSALLIETESNREHFCALEEPEILKAMSQKLEAIKVFTTRPDTIFGATYLVISPEHEWISELLLKIENKSEVESYITQAKKKTEIERTAEGKEKTGVELKGVRAINPANGEEIPVWTADYVLSGYGTGAIMAVPADDKRDQDFAEKFNLPIVKNYTPAGFTDFGNKVIKYKLRDWGVSRQRYWGVPIPIIYCEKCGQVPVPDKDLPVKLPEIKDYLPRDDGKSPLAKALKWVNVKCPNCKGKAERETDTLDTFVDSSWYFLRYTDPKNKKEFASKEKMNNWIPVDFYSGGAEHTTMHLLYSRFWQKALFDLGFVKHKEPYKIRMSRGLILGPDGNKMSKSKGNVIDPDEIVSNLGADTVRTYLAFIGPFAEVTSHPWSAEGIVGVRRFLEKVWKLQEKVASKKSQVKNLDLESLINETIKKITEDIETLKFNTGVSGLMILTNEMGKREKISEDEYKTLLLLLSPFAPHITEELWSIIGEKKSIHLSPWPKFDSKKIKTVIKIAIQVNGKTREIMEIDDKSSEKEITDKALSLPNIKKWMEGKTLKRVVYIKNKIINIVID